MTHSHLLVAGTFDNFHVGHQYLLWSASERCQKMTVVVARDKTVQRIKGRFPVNSELQRLSRIEQELLPQCTIRLGRSDQDFFRTIEEVSPSAIFLGYDQKFDTDVAQERYPDIQIMRAGSYLPGVFKSSKFLA